VVHTDLCGPLPASFQGFEYFQLIIDDYSWKMWVYFLRKKSEAFANFQTFYQQATRQSGKPLLLLRSDGGGEFVFKEVLSIPKAA
ncbi:hypothetical protein KI387_042033, partial [Taxus chinensis]